ncbi:MAG: glycosyltransferase [Patescibacteria group bacterium]|nr:glycosyltransferase [Patescibacteria group bacterium]
MVKVSVITTFKNESKAIKEFLDSLLNQSRKPDEIVFCDGNSSDQTVEIIRQYNTHGIPLKLVSKSGGISVGRNAAIKAASFDIIACTDVGCRLLNDWLENIIRPFEENSKVYVVSGLFKPDPKTFFESVSSSLLLSDHDNLDLKNWLPSSRSIAFKKEAWKKVGGYPESIPFAGEDTLFDLNLKKAGFEFVLAKDAIVYWRPRKNIKEFFDQYKNYSFGDGLARTNTKNYFRKIYFYIILICLILTGIFSNTLILVTAMLIIILYWLRRSRHMWRKNLVITWLAYAPLIITTKDVADAIGFTKGYFGHE